ncbi:CsbD family protein [Methylobacterium oxalidis]|uniref:CsbD family protein n=1 Tax=Methylobacterium oxalidis TaxID=944322 RepID=UPI003316424A
MAKAPDPTAAKAVKGSVTEALGKIMADPQTEAKGAAQKRAGKAEAQAAKPDPLKGNRP